MNCSICKRKLEYQRKRGWFHKETNSIYIMRCKDCGYEGGNSITCPNCGDKNYVDDHCVSPDWSVEPTGETTALEDYFRPLENIGIFKKPEIERKDNIK